MNKENMSMINYIKTDDILYDMREIIDASQKKAYQAINIALVQRN